MSNSYASPERQLPQNDPYGLARPEAAGAFQSRLPPERGDPYAAQGRQPGFAGQPDEERAKVSPFVTPA